MLQWTDTNDNKIRLINVDVHDPHGQDTTDICSDSFAVKRAQDFPLPRAIFKTKHLANSQLL